MGSVTFDYVSGTGSLWTCPAGVTTVTVTAYGTTAHTGGRRAAPGKGQMVKCDVEVTPGDTYFVMVQRVVSAAHGGLASGFMPSVGGGPADTDEWLVIAGGAGEGGEDLYVSEVLIQLGGPGGNGGQDGTDGAGIGAGTHGEAGTGTAGGANGTNSYTSPDPLDVYFASSPGELPNGGNGGSVRHFTGSGFDHTVVADGGYGGQGWWGGGGGEHGNATTGSGAGGGGGHHLSTGVNETIVNDAWTSTDGRVILSWTSPQRGIHRGRVVTGGVSR